jgi:hypothetical protein
MTTKRDFNAEEWSDLAQAPVLAALKIMLAERGGAIRESIALGKAYNEARSGATGGELIGELVSSPPQVDPGSMGQADQLRQELPDRIRAAVRLVEEKATPEEAEEYRRFIVRVADVVAHAAKEGGVLGIGGKQVTEQEQAALDELERDLSATGR